MYDQNTIGESDTTDVGSRLDPVLARSWLLVNGAQYSRFAPAARSRADIVVLDIEDAVAPKDKDAARANVVRWLTGEGAPTANGVAGGVGDAGVGGAGVGGAGVGGASVGSDGAGGAGDWVRINGFGTPWWADDLAALSKTPVGGVMLAMVESVDHITETAKRLPDVPIVALVETARGLERISEIASAKGTFRLAFGIGDFRRDTGFGDSPTTLAYARSRFTIAAKAAHLPSAIDGPTVGSGALKLSEATSVSIEFGMTGKICLTPDQCAPVNEGLSPSHDDIAWAREFFADFERDGGEIRNGSDLPRIARATKILDLARAYSVTATDYEVDPGHVPAPSDTYHY
ncbi:CoA ester lyase [Gordonia sinesedis]